MKDKGVCVDIKKNNTTELLSMGQKVQLVSMQVYIILKEN